MEAVTLETDEAYRARITALMYFSPEDPVHTETGSRLDRIGEAAGCVRTTAHKPDGGPAYPSTAPGVLPFDPGMFSHTTTADQPSPFQHTFNRTMSFGDEPTVSYPGMSVRDAAALAALPAILAHDFSVDEPDEVATKAFAIADAFIKARDA